MATRRERVILDLEDRLSPGMAKAAASTALLNRELGSLSRDSVNTRRGISDIDRPVQSIGRSSERSSNQIDRLSGRMRILADVAAILGPSLIPIGAIAVPAITGLAAQFGFAAVGAGTAILAFQGVGDAVKALNTAALEPTTANLKAAQIALEQLSPAAQGFVSQLGEMRPALKALRDEAAEGLFPGLTEALDSLEGALPRVQSIIASVSSELGDIAADTGASLASDRWAPFLDFIAAEAPEALREMSDATGNVAHAMANLWMAFDPLNDDFSQWLVDATRSLDQWSAGLSQTQGFQEFVAYIRETGPQVADTFAAIGNAVLQVVQAAAPLGGPVLAGIEALANAVAAIADSDMGTPIFTAVAALSLFNRTVAITGAMSRATFGGPAITTMRGWGGSIRGVTADLRTYSAVQNTAAGRARASVAQMNAQAAAAGRLRANLAGVGMGAAVLGGLAIASTGAADGMGLTNTASLALMGTIAGPWGTVIGGAAGLLLDAKAAGDGFADSLDRARVAVKGDDVDEIRAALADLKKQREDLEHISGIGDFFSDRFSGGMAGQNAAIRDFDDQIAKLKDRLDFTKEEAQQRLLADGFTATAAGIDSASGSTQDFITELQSLSDVLAGRASFRDFEQAIDDFAERAQKRAEILGKVRDEESEFVAKMAGLDRDLAAARKDGDGDRVADIQARRAQEKSAHEERVRELREQADELKNTLDTDTQAGRDTEELLDRIANTALAMASKLDPIKRAEFLAGARTEFIKAAKEAGLLDDAANKLADDVLGLSTLKGKVKIVVDADGAYRVIDLVARRLERLTRGTHIINIKAQAAKNQDIVGDIHGFAGGGWTGPGAKHQPAGVVHADEFVFSKEATHGRVGYLSALHQEMRGLRGYANGGLVQPVPMASGGLSDQDVDRIAGALLSARSIYGNVTVVGDGSFEREQRQRLSALDGIRRG